MLCLMMIPALAHDARPGTRLPFPTCAGPALRFACLPVSDATRAVMVPFPVSGWRAKAKLSVTTSPPGPCGT